MVRRATLLSVFTLVGLGYGLTGCLEERAVDTAIFACETHADCGKRHECLPRHDGVKVCFPEGMGPDTVQPDTSPDTVETPDVSDIADAVPDAPDLVDVTDVPEVRDAVDVVDVADVGDVLDTETDTVELCGDALCGTNETCCGEECVDLMHNDNHCGSCTTVCDPTQDCLEGICGCPDSFEDCDNDGTCELLTSDVSHCGGCDVACDPNETCSDGDCLCGTNFCGDDQICCDAAGTKKCESFMLSVANCGACGVVCGAGEICSGGACICGQAVGALGGGPACSGDGEACCADNCVQKTDPDCKCGAAGTCGDDQLCCSDVCVDKLVDSANCGQCDDVCAAHLTCQQGVCSCPEATPNPCPGDVCVDLASDPFNCRTCGNTCPDNTICDVGNCICAEGFEDCDGDPLNGCETPTTDDITNCGGCGILCSEAGGTASCNQGVCEIVCDADHADCDTDLTNGCETLITDTANCGGCGVTCSDVGGTADCVGGACTITCLDGFEDCDADITNGCEDISTDPQRCGSCTNVCATGANANATTCVDGQCGLECLPDYGDCNGQLDDGCETDTTASDEHCGACAAPCADLNGQGTCVQSVCDFVCDGTWADCDGLGSNGCETDTAITYEHCGACNAACQAPDTDCVSGGCVTN